MRQKKKKKKKKKEQQNWASSLGRVGRDLSISPAQKLRLRIPIKSCGRCGLWKERNGLFPSLSLPIVPRALPYLVMSLPSLPVTERAKTKKSDGLCGDVAVEVQVHLFTLIQLQYNNNRKKKK